MNVNIVTSVPTIRPQHNYHNTASVSIKNSITCRELVQMFPYEKRFNRLFCFVFNMSTFRLIFLPDSLSVTLENMDTRYIKQFDKTRRR